MDLKGLIDAGAFVDEGVVPKQVVWKKEDKTEVTFDILVKAEQSVADFEFITFGMSLKGEDNSEASWMARRVHRLCRIGSDGKDVVPYETAKRMKYDLLLAICDKINEVHKVKSKEEKEAEPKN